MITRNDDETSKKEWPWVFPVLFNFEFVLQCYNQKEISNMQMQ